MFRIPLQVTFGLVAVALLSSVATMAVRGRPPGSPAAVPPRAPEPVSPGVVPAVPGGPAPPDPPGAPLPASGTGATSHGRLVLDGHFARRIGLVAMLQQVALPGKRVQHAPQDHLITALVNVLAGHTQLQQISRGETPLRADRALAHAWAQPELPDVSGVCRLLHTTDWATAEAVRTGLQTVFAPYVALCQGRAQAGGARLAVDWDLSAKAITTEATSEPFATYGHMEDGLGKGYQWAEAVLRGIGPDGQPRPVALGGFLQPGNAHPPACVDRLRQITEAALGRPWRRPDLLERRLTVAQTHQQQRRARVDALGAQLSTHQQRRDALADHLRRVEQRRARRAPQHRVLQARDERAAQRLQRRLARAEQQVCAAHTRLAVAQAAAETAGQVWTALSTRLAQLQADNAALAAANQPGVAIEVVMDAQFGSSAIVASLLEDGYAVTTKATSPATIATLQRRQAAGAAVFGAWRPVSANAEVAECHETRYADCPYAVRLLGYRKHLAASTARPARTRSALFLTSVPPQERAGPAVVQHYHVRGGSVELVNRQAKSYLGWRGHRLRHAPGLDILGQFVFASLNFVPWLADTVWAESHLPTSECPGLAEWTRMARAPAAVVTEPSGVIVQFRPDSGWPHRTLRLGPVRQPPLPGFAWPGVPINAHLPLPTSPPALVARKLG